MIRIETLSVFPQMFDAPMSLSILGRARKAGILSFEAHDLRDWTHDKHNTTDDEIFGGGAGQLMKVEPVFEALDDLLASEPAHVVFFTPTGTPFSQQLAADLAKKQRIIMVCGRYEGFDERVYTRADACISLGDYVLTGGELAAMVVTDAVCRLLPGVLGDEQSSVDESFSTGLLEYPQYTRPASYRGMDVPEVLLSGNHRLIAEWRRRQSIIKTAQSRPDLLKSSELTAEEWEMVKALQESEE
jgi:tRNA (guanine37-N1)-methyltransferase